MSHKNIVFFLCAMGLAVPEASAFAASETCDAASYKVPPELSGWAHPVEGKATGAQKTSSAFSLTLGQAAQVPLLPASERQFVLQSGALKHHFDFAGMVRFHISKKETYRVMLGGKAWIDVVSDGKSLDSVAHQHGPACSGIVKMVDFILEPGDYVLQLSGNAQQDVKVMILQAS
ncbi:hypothetical protein [Acetobacter senegalensis]|uniref:hypothetical protein n=1 Tax=Acetobacter senegalensis TaxID=446692 RepID=UPI001EDCE715|nr:hypothetical protein [Acetobacter senegalensis]MCG4273194.1 hypothetical protein [Acetobacter senegalensis]